MNRINFLPPDFHMSLSLLTGLVTPIVECLLPFFEVTLDFKQKVMKL